MPTATFQLAAGITASGTGDQVLYTVPANSVVIVKSIVLAQQSDDAVAAGVVVSARPAGGGITVVLVTSSDVTYATPLYWTGWVVLKATDSLVLHFNNRCNFIVSGAMLPVP